MKKILVCALRPWSLRNIQPVIDAMTDVEWHINNYTIDISPSEFDLIITCEPHDKHWFEYYTDIKRKTPVIAMQQSLFYSTTYGIDTEEYYDKYLIWGGQMYDFLTENDNTISKAVITGCPFHDHLFDIVTEDKGYTLGLEGGDSHEGLPWMKGLKNVIVISHPNKTNYKMREDTLELIRCAHKVVVHSTGCGIYALIMKKDCKILGHNERYNNWDKPWFLEWAIGTKGATERVIKEIKEYL